MASSVQGMANGFSSAFPVCEEGRRWLKHARTPSDEICDNVHYEAAGAVDPAVDPHADEGNKGGKGEDGFDCFRKWRSIRCRSMPIF